MEKYDWERYPPELQSGRLLFSHSREELIRKMNLNVVRINVLVEQRDRLRRRQQYDASDKIREELDKLGVAVQDCEDGTSTWTF